VNDVLPFVWRGLKNEARVIGGLTIIYLLLWDDADEIICVEIYRIVAWSLNVMPESTHNLPRTTPKKRLPAHGRKRGFQSLVAHGSCSQDLFGEGLPHNG
jgi:hypothetical protein